MRARGQIDGRWAILVADDDDVARELVVRYLDKLCLANPVVTAHDGNEVVDLLSGGLLPVLVMLDLDMPGRSGVEVLTWMRGRPALASVPVVMLTANGDLDNVDDAYALGVSSYLVKPVGFSAIADVLRGLALPWALVPGPCGAEASSTA